MGCMLSVHNPCIYMYNVIQIQMEVEYKFSQMTAVLGDACYVRRKNVQYYIQL